MKHILVYLAGAADSPLEELDGVTPLEIARVPNLTHFVKIGKVGQVKLYSDRFDSVDDVALVNLLGYDADKNYTGRGPIEAANLELKLEENEIPFCLNFITESNGKLADPTAGMVSTKESKALINFLNKKVASDFVRFFPGSQYRHVAVIKDAHGWEALSAKNDSPYSVVGEPIEQHFPKGPGDELLKKLMYDARLLLQDHEINQVRVDLQENPANMIWLWGQGRWPKYERFAEKSGLNGAMIAGMEYSKGIARLAGMAALETAAGLVENEQDLEREAKLAVEALEDFDFVCLHLNACDEASRLGDVRMKVSALESFDYFVLSKLKDYLEKNKEVRLLITPGFAALSGQKKRRKEAVPFVMAGKNITPDDIEKFSEQSARASEWKVQKPADLFASFILK